MTEIIKSDREEKRRKIAEDMMKPSVLINQDPENEDRIVDPTLNINQDEFTVNSSKVQVLLCRRPDGVYFIRVRIQSKKPVTLGEAVWTQGEVEFDRQLEKKIEALGGALAEIQNEKLGDTHEPSDCARAAKEAWRKLAVNMKTKGIW